MKIRIKKASKINLATKVVLVFSSILIAVAVPIQMSNSFVSAETIEEINARYDAQKAAIQQEIDSYDAQLTQLSAQAATLQSALTILSIQKSEIQAQLDATQAKYDNLVIQIAETEKQISVNKDALGITIANLYVDGNITPIEMLASSSNIGDYLDKQEYNNSVRTELSSTILKIKNLKVQLDSQKLEVEGVLVQQKSQKDILAAKEAEQQNLLNETKGQEEAYQQLSAQKSAEIEAANQQQRKEIAKLTNNGKNTSFSSGSFEVRNYSGNQGACGGGYPGSDTGIYGQVWGCNYAHDYPYNPDAGIYNFFSDKWALYNRECVSYAAWAAYTRFGKKVTSFMGAGMAYQWPSTVLSMGANVDNTPEVGAVAITPQQYATPSGHAMIVEEVYGDGWIGVSQYNFGGTGDYSTMDLKVSSAVYIHFQDRFNY